ncbi:MAG: hypothetical protein V2I67_19295, partial [Thermoanaerobaculales bacterium]|nr:hypothetical protein [Thermoanaerobaculales bacterium]
RILAGTPYTAPFAALGQLRSAGITDLRFGRVVDDDRQVVPLPDGVDCFAVAGTTAATRSTLADRLIGDGLVPVASALGRHDDPAWHLEFPHDAQHIAFRTTHLGLLSSPGVARQIMTWLSPSPSAARRSSDTVGV